jgi:ADP-dependent NAD(P)H-hydrate dehydratase
MEIVHNVPILEPRPADGHKGTFGKVCIVAGSVGMSGAAALAGRAALRSGAGLVRVATAWSAAATVDALEPCYTTIPLAEDSAGRISAEAIHTILDTVAENDAAVIGPGLGTSAGLRSVIAILLQQENLRLLIDGDGLNNLSKLPDWPKQRQADVILTPHPGEMQRLWSGLFREEMPGDRQEAAGRLAQATGSTVALKGAGTVVTDGQRVYLNNSGNPGMATAGSGDVLTGVIIALMGQGLDSFAATVLGVHIHGVAGDIAADDQGQISLIATDIVETLSEAFRRNRKHSQ